MPATKGKSVKQSDDSFSFRITDDGLHVNVNLSRRQTLLVLGAIGSPFLAELVKALLNLH
jgi:hypothetical protein